LKRIIDALKLLKNERLRGFRVDIEVDSTIYGDSEQEKKDRIEFLQMVTQYLQTAGGMAAQFPDVAELLGKMLQFGVRGFKVGRDLEVAIGEFVDNAPEMIAKYKAQQQSQQSPERAHAEAEIKKAEMMMQLTQIKGQNDMQSHAAEVKRQHLESQSEAYNASIALEQKQGDIEMQRMQIEIEKIKAQADQTKAQTALLMAQMQAKKAVQTAMTPEPILGEPDASRVPPQSSAL
jgi:hypothetical protein